MRLNAAYPLRHDSILRVTPTRERRSCTSATAYVGSAHRANEYSAFTARATNKHWGFPDEVIGEPYAVSDHSSGGILAAYYVASNDASNVTALVLEDPPLFRVTPEEAQEGAGTFAWHDGYTVTHSFLNQNRETDYAVRYAAHSYLLGLFGGLQPLLADQTAAWCHDHPGEHVVNAWVPRACGNALRNASTSRSIRVTISTSSGHEISSTPSKL